MYSKVSKYSPEARKRMTYRSSKGKSCGYYMRIVFFFSSLIQSLIIVSLVLFLVYGKQQDTTSVARVQDLELRFSQLSLETVSLRQQRKNLTHLLNVTSMEKARNEWDLAQLRFTANISYILLDDTEKKLQQCNFERRSNRINCPLEIPRTPINPFQTPFGGCNCGMQMETLKAKMELLQANFTQTAMQMQMEMDQISRERDNINLEAIQLRRDKSVHEKAIQFYQIKCKEEFVNSLSGISNVSKAFLTKIDSLFHTLSPFHLTCPKQKDYLDQIRTNCSDLSEEVVSKFQTYLDTLGNRVSMYQGNISVLTAENIRMTRDYNLCSQNRTGLIREHKQHVERVQLRNDEEKEKLLKEKLRLKGDIDVLESSIKLKNSQLDHMNEQLKHLNLSCIPRTGGLFPRLGNQPSSPWGPQSGSSNQGFGQFNRNSNFGSSSSSSSSGSPFGSNTGLGLSNSGFNKPASTGLGSPSLGSNSGLGSSSLNKLGSNNQGSSSSLFGSSATGLNKQTSTGTGSSSSLFGSSLGSSNTGLNKQTSTGLGSSSSSFGSSLGSSNTGLNKQTSTGLGSSSSSSFGSSLGSSNTGLNKQTSTGIGASSSSSLGSPFGSPNNPSSSSSSLNKFGSSASAGSSSSSFGSKLGSSSSNLGSNFGSSSNTGLGSSSSSSSSKVTSNSRGSSPSFFGSSSSSSGLNLGSSSSSQNKLSSSSNSKDSSSSSSSSSATTNKNPFGGWFGLGGGSSSSSSSNSNSDQSKLGSNQGRGSSTSGNGFGSFGSGRTNTFSFTGPISVNQHLRDLQRIINPSSPEEKQELSRILG